MAARGEEAASHRAVYAAHGVYALVAVARYPVAARYLPRLHGLAPDMAQSVVQAAELEALFLLITHVPEAAATAAKAVFTLRSPSLGGQLHWLERSAVDRRGAHLDDDYPPYLAHYRSRHEHRPALYARNAAAGRAVAAYLGLIYLVFNQIFHDF